MGVCVCAQPSLHQYIAVLLTKPTPNQCIKVLQISAKKSNNYTSFCMDPRSLVMDAVVGRHCSVITMNKRNI